MLSDKLKQSGIEALEKLADYCNKTTAERARLVRRITGESDVVYAYEMGWSYHDNGPDQVNCHWTVFETVETKDAWEKGFKDAKRGGR